MSFRSWLGGKKAPPRLNLGYGEHRLRGFVNLDKTDGWTFESGLKNFAAASVAGITISHALMYVHEKDIPFVISELHRVLVPGGILRITEDDTQNPESLAFGGWRGEDPFDRRRLAHDDRRFGGKQPALRLVHGPRHAVETRREMDQRRPPESLVALPPRHFGEREMDLHLRATEPMAARAGLDRGG